LRKPIIAIDGPAGSGKSTVAREVARRLGYVYIDTGAMYRAVAWRAIVEGIPITRPDAITALAERMDISFRRVDGQRVIADSTDVTEAIRTPEVTQLSSPVSAIEGVRKRLVEMQREMGEGGGVVMEGRDIGTVVFPDAEIKIFLTASDDERARRRAAELEANGVSVDIELVAREMRERDLRDSTREHAPLRQADDAVRIDTDGMSIEDVVRAVLDIHDRKVGTASIHPGSDSAASRIALEDTGEGPGACIT